MAKRMTNAERQQTEAELAQVTIDLKKSYDRLYSVSDTVKSLEDCARELMRKLGINAFNHGNKLLTLTPDTVQMRVDIEALKRDDEETYKKHLRGYKCRGAFKFQLIKAKA